MQLSFQGRMFFLIHLGQYERQKGANVLSFALLNSPSVYQLLGDDIKTKTIANGIFMCAQK